MKHRRMLNTLRHCYMAIAGTEVSQGIIVSRALELLVERGISALKDEAVSAQERTAIQALAGAND